MRIQKQGQYMLCSWKKIMIAVNLTDKWIKKWQVNVVKGLKMYEDVFTDSELSKLTGFVNELRAAGQNGQLSGKYLSNLIKSYPNFVINSVSNITFS